MLPASPLPPPPPGFSPEDWSILATVAYAEVFAFAPTAAEIARGLVGAVLDEAEVAQRLAASPALTSRIGAQGGYHFLHGSQALVERRRAGARSTEAMLAEHHQTLKWITALPFVRMVALSGGTAFKNSIEKEDLDLFLVARAGRAWTAYFLMASTLRLRGIRPVVCANYWVDEAHLTIERNQDLFTASQLAHLVPIYGGDAWRQFVAANEWVESFFPGHVPHPAPDRGPSMWKRAVEAALWLASAPLEALVRAGLGARFKKSAGEHSDLYLSEGVLKLHLSDHRPRAMDRWLEKLETLAPQPQRSASAVR